MCGGITPQHPLLNSHLKMMHEPIYASKGATFDFPIYLSLADKLGAVELVV
jgi:phosphatidylserine decarboxylase